MGNSNTGRDKHVNEKEVKSGELRDDFNPNVKGEKAPNVRTENMGTAEVPATRQKSISPKGKKADQDGDAT